MLAVAEKDTMFQKKLKYVYHILTELHNQTIIYTF